MPGGFVSVAQIRTWNDGLGRTGRRLYLWCPGCLSLHCVELDGPNAWTWDGNLTAPTISPSILATWNGNPNWRPDDDDGSYQPPPSRCHSFVRAGQWEFLTDSSHQLAGQTVPLSDLPDWFAREDAD